LMCFTTYFLLRMQRDTQYSRRVKSLAGETLGCFCSPRPCHGLIYKAFLEGTLRDFCTQHGWHKRSRIIQAYVESDYQL